MRRQRLGSDHSEVYVEHTNLSPTIMRISLREYVYKYVTYQFRMSMDDMLNTFPSERFLTESSLDVIEYFSMCRVSLV